PTTAPPTTAPPTTPAPAPAPATVSPTAAELADVRDLLTDGLDRGQLTDEAATRIGERLTAVNTRLASGDDDRVQKARDELVAVRQEIDQQVADGEANPGIANQLLSEVDEVEATLA
ncbi:hypothetical protein, partial [Salsipaludibacter albus]|uniref:hypothetical protein n=1 Tax=Salsipaludibacter albus TaxID=2849650 RepID=UPI0023682542